MNSRRITRSRAADPPTVQENAVELGCALLLFIVTKVVFWTIVIKVMEACA